MTFLAIPSRAVCGMGEPGAPIICFVTACAFRRPRHDLEGLQVAVAVAAFKSAVGPHQRESRLVVVELRDVPGRRPMACITIPAERAFVIISVACGAIPVGFLKLFPFVALDTGNALVEREKVLGRMLERDVREWKTGGMAILTFLPKICVVRRTVAIVAVRLRCLLSVACFAGQFPVAAAQRETGLGVLFEKGCVRRAGYLRQVGRAKLDRLRATCLQKKGHGRQSRDQDDNEHRLRVLPDAHRCQSPQSLSFHFSP